MVQASRLLCAAETAAPQLPALLGPKQELGNEKCRLPARQVWLGASTRAVGHAVKRRFVFRSSSLTGRANRRTGVFLFFAGEDLNRRSHRTATILQDAAFPAS